MESFLEIYIQCSATGRSQAVYEDFLETTDNRAKTVIMERQYLHPITASSSGLSISKSLNGNGRAMVNR